MSVNQLFSIAAKRLHLVLRAFYFMITLNILLHKRSLSAIFWPLLKTTDWKPLLDSHSGNRTDFVPILYSVRIAKQKQNI